MDTTTIADLHQTLFMQELSAHAAQILRDAGPKYAKEGRARSLSRPLQAHEHYARNTLLTAGQLLKVCDQMEYATQLLSGFRGNKNGALSLTRYEYLVFQVENHILRTGMVLDRALKLVNTVFDLGLPARECRFAIVTQNARVVNSPTAILLKKLQIALQTPQKQRNIIAHHESFDDEILYHVELHSVLQKTSEINDATVQRFSSLIKTYADQFVKTKRSELQSINQSVAAHIAHLFDSLRQPFALGLQGKT
jgi:hypothetical protein